VIVTQQTREQRTGFQRWRASNQPVTRTVRNGNKMKISHTEIPNWIIALATVGLFALAILTFFLRNTDEPPVEQNTMGDRSPNIYAPSATGITVNYGISEKTLNELTEQVKGKENVIAYLLEDLEVKKVEIKKKQALVEDWIEMYKEMEKRSAVRLSHNDTPGEASKRIEPLKKFTHQEFIDNFVAFRAYYRYRKTLLLLNPDKLIEFINIYLRSILLYPSTEMKKYYINASDGRLLRLAIEGHNQKGEKILISVPELSSSLLHDVCNDFIKSANAKDYEMILNLFKRALSTPELDKVHKLNIMDAEAFIRKNKLLHNF
jgi:hypothetical protein